MRTVLSILMLLATATLAQAGPQDDARQVVERWVKAFSEADADGVAGLYAPDALMIGTAGKVVLTKPEQIHKYFETALVNNQPNATLLSSESLAADDNTVVIAGFDKVTLVHNGQNITSMGRVTFVVAKRGADWKIVHLHRSPLPAN
jgi:uncharacterized protein (TIGR02246 family)